MPWEHIASGTQATSTWSSLNRVLKRRGNYTGKGYKEEVTFEAERSAGRLLT